MKQKIFFFAVAVLMAFALPVNAQYTNYDFSAVAPTGQTLYYKINGSSVEVTHPRLGGGAGGWSGYTRPTGALTIPDSVSYGSTVYIVTSIDTTTFFGCGGLTSVAIPISVTCIESRAFYLCRGLLSLTIPSTVISIEDDAFQAVRHIEYYGSATGSPWGARTMNGTWDNDFFYLDSTRQYIVLYFGFGGDVTIPSTVYTIGNGAFRNCNSVTSVTIPNSVVNIGDSVFYGCSGLTSVVIPNSVTNIGNYAFYNCIGLISATIGNSVNSIGNHAFGNCNSLTSITIPNSVTNMGNGAFYGCSGLTSVTISNSLTNIADYAFYGCNGLTSLTIPSSVNNIGNYAFYDCNGLTSVTIPNSVTSIGIAAFSNCVNSFFVTIPNSAISIGENAFQYIKHIEYHGTATGAPWGALSMNGVVDGVFVYDDSARTILQRYIGSDTSVTIPGTVAVIGTRAFNNCGDLTSVTIPATIDTLYNLAFSGCYGLTSINYLGTIVQWCRVVFFDGFPISHSLRIGGVEVTDLVIPDSLTSIGNYTFIDCGSLVSVTIPNSVTIIGDCAFARCINMTSLTIPNTVTSIGNEAFSECYYLTTIVCHAQVPPIVGQNAFSWVSDDADLRVPCLSLPAYRTANGWSAFLHLYSLSNCLQSVTVASNDTTLGTAKVIYNDTSMICAYPNVHCRFVGWSDSVTDNPRLLFTEPDTVLTAYFEHCDTVVEEYGLTEVHDTTIIVDTVYVDSKTSNVNHKKSNGTKYPGTQGSFFVNNERTFVVDGPNCLTTAYTEIGNTVSGYPDSALIQSPEDIISVCINMEHSYMGDIEIALLCPSYDSADLSGHGMAMLKYKNSTDTNGLGTPIPYGTWGGGGRYMGIPYGGSNDGDYDHMLNGGDCDSIYNPYGFGYDYCFSRNASRTLVNGQPANTPLPSYAGLANAPLVNVTHGFQPIPAGYAAAGQSCGEVNVNTLPASSREKGTGFYVPASDFTSLVGCPVNGEWKIVIHDYWGQDNGWVFNWSIDFGVNLQVLAQDTALGSINGGGIAASNATTLLTAMPKAGNYFLGWSDGSEDNPYNLTVESDSTIVAYFAERDSIVVYDTVDTLFVHDTIWIHDTLYVGIGDIDVVTAKIYQRDGQIVVEGTEGNRVALYDVNGRMVATKHDDLSTLYFDIPVTGTYLVKIGNHPARKVVVIR